MAVPESLDTDSHSIYSGFSRTPHSRSIVCAPAAALPWASKAALACVKTACTGLISMAAFLLAQGHACRRLNERFNPRQKEVDWQC